MKLETQWSRVKKAEFHIADFARGPYRQQQRRRLLECQLSLMIIDSVGAALLAKLKSEGLAGV